MAENWREVRKGEWWLLFTDAPDPVEQDGKIVSGTRDGCRWPPSMVIHWAGDGACVHLYDYVNGAEPTDPGAEIEGNENEDYLHICDPLDHVGRIQAWIETAGYKPPAWKENDLD